MAGEGERGETRGEKEIGREEETERGMKRGERGREERERST